MTLDKAKELIEKTAKQYKINEYNYVVGDEIYENNKYYMFNFHQNVEEPMDGMLFLIDKTTEQVMQTDYISMPVSQLNSMKPVK